MVVDLDIKPQDIDRIIEMAWEDRTPFEAIEYQFGLKENLSLIHISEPTRPS